MFKCVATQNAGKRRDSHADTEVGRESGRDRVGVRLNPWVKVLVGVTVLGRDKCSAGMQHNVRDDAQKSPCDARKGAREPDAESGCVMWPSCCMRRWRFFFVSGGLQEVAGPSHLVWPGLFPRGCCRPWVEEVCIRSGPAASSWLLSSATLCGWPLTSLRA